MMFEKTVVLDLETTGLDPHRDDILLIAYRYINTNTVIVSKDFEPKTFSNLNIIGHNLKFDLKFLAAKGYKISYKNYFGDTQLMSAGMLKKVPETWLNNYEKERRSLNITCKLRHNSKGSKIHRSAKPNSLKVLAPYFLSIPPFWENPGDYDNIDYVQKDVNYTLELYNHFQNIMMKEGTLEFYQQKLMPWARMCLKAELEGINIDVNKLKKLKTIVKEKIQSLENKLYIEYRKDIEEYQKLITENIVQKYKEMKNWQIEKKFTKKNIQPGEILNITAKYDKLCEKALSKLPSFNFSSPKQLLYILGEVRKYDLTYFDRNKQKETRGVGSKVLQKLSEKGYKDVNLILAYREKTKLLNSFILPYLEKHINNKIYTTYNISLARTGRTSSSNVNLQQVPPALREVFIPKNGNVFIRYDLEAIEPNLIAYYTEDKTLCNILLNNENFHSYAAKTFFKLDIEPNLIKDLYPDHRKAAKEGDLSLFYGAGKYTYQAGMRKFGFVFSLNECEEMIENYKNSFSDVWKYRKKLEYALKNGGSVENLFGRKFKLDSNRDIHLKGLNTLIQGSASDLLLESVKDTLEDVEKKYLTELRLLVHDEVVLECPKEYADIVQNKLKYNLTKWNLNTKWGTLKLKCEGTIEEKWGK